MARLTPVRLPLEPDTTEVVNVLDIALKHIRALRDDLVPYATFETVPAGAAEAEAAPEPSRNVAHRLARAFHEAALAEGLTPSSLWDDWDEMSIGYQTMLANVFADLLRRGVIRE